MTASIVTIAFPGVHLHRDPAATNVHPMETRSKSGIFKPKMLMSTCQPLSLSFIEPTSVQEALKGIEWRKAMELELDAIQRNNTWILVQTPPNRKISGCK